ncbi:MAG: pyridoxal 5'-phosphate synthase glutaminase subunit PdxT [Pseudoclavibacter sp.]|nr:pyridoxal 5'-phosphate synthase glutaminase subunit PdxT [Pseudoclavibacter sp.]
MVSERPVGVLALQGDVREHARALRRLGREVRLVRAPEQLRGLAGLVLPGGESSVIDRLARLFGLRAPIREAIRAGLPAYGSCAGMILLAERLEGGVAGQETFGGLDVTVRRNAFGSQLDSFETELEVPAIGADARAPVRAVFIRAPLVVETGPAVERLAQLPDGGVVAVRQGSLLATAFHPELSGEDRIHRAFLRTVDERGFEL